MVRMRGDVKVVCKEGKSVKVSGHQLGLLMIGMGKGKIRINRLYYVRDVPKGGMRIGMRCGLSIITLYGDGGFYE